MFSGRVSEFPEGHIEQEIARARLYRARYGDASPYLMFPYGGDIQPLSEWITCPYCNYKQAIAWWPDRVRPVPFCIKCTLEL